MLRRVQERISGHEFWASWKVTGSALARNSAGPHPAGPGPRGFRVPTRLPDVQVFSSGSKHSPATAPSFPPKT